MPRHVLVAEDDTDTRNALCEMLQQQGYMVYEASDGRGALLVLKHTRVDAAILDLMMPHMDGIRLVDEMRRLERVPPFIIMSAYCTNAGLRYWQWKLGAHDAVAKPFDADALLQRLAAIFDVRRSDTT